jgi:hypothetical protein
MSLTDWQWYGQGRHIAAVLTRRAKNRLRREAHPGLQFNNWEHPMSLFRSDDSRERRKSNRYDLQYLAHIDPGDGWHC